MQIKFKAYDYTKEGKFIRSSYEFLGNKQEGWEVKREGKTYLKLGKGYEVLKTRICGICSTDIARKFLPYQLPQVIGHELVAESLEDKRKYVVEINDTSYYRDEDSLDIFSQNGLKTHTPDRMVLGIDRLPGGFSPYILAPIKSAIPIQSLDEYTAVLIEPFAAALQAVISSPPKDTDSVAVLGPRRLGTLLIAALVAYRNLTGKKYKITAISRHESLLDLCFELGSDFGVNLSDTDTKDYENKYDIVYDTTGSPSGFEVALKLSAAEVHLKSTTGIPTLGLNKLTELVVDELSILPLKEEYLNFVWENENRKNLHIYTSPELTNIDVGEKINYQLNIEDALKKLKTKEFSNSLPRFDIGIVTKLEELDKVIRPTSQNEESLIRPRGAILFQGDSKDNLLLEFVSNGGRIRTSRCGDFQRALDILEKDKKLSEKLSFFMISHLFPVKELPEAFQIAEAKRSVKVVVKHL